MSIHHYKQSAISHIRRAISGKPSVSRINNAHRDNIKRQINKRIPLAAGESVENYLIEAIIGGGGFSLVYQGYDTRTGTRVVIKEYFPSQLAERNQGNVQVLNEKKRKAYQVGIQQFFSEARSLAKIRHPNIIDITNILRANNTVYMVFRLQHGRDLRWFIKSCRGSLDQDFLFQIFPPILSALKALHAQEFLHLDIKPANILLRTKGGPLLLDFGAVASMSKEERFTSFQTLTPGFAPPEQHNKEALSIGSDIYAIGSTIYACITGNPPRPSIDRKGDDDLLKLKGAEKKITSSSLEAIRSALELDTHNRPKTIDEFADLFLSDSYWGDLKTYEKHLFSQPVI